MSFQSGGRDCRPSVAGLSNLDAALHFNCCHFSANLGSQSGKAGELLPSRWSRKTPETAAARPSHYGKLDPCHGGRFRTRTYASPHSARLGSATILTMTGKFKFLILLVALVALPLRGMAAVAMWHCMQEQRDAMSVSADQHAEHHDHQSHSDQAPDHSHDAATHDESPDHPASPAASACSACAACCVGGAVVPAAWTSFSFAPIGASRIPFVEQRFTGVVPAQLERPPLLQSL